MTDDEKSVDAVRFKFFNELFYGLFPGTETVTSLTSSRLFRNNVFNFWELKT